MTNLEAIEYFYRVMENGNIRNDEQQEAYEKAIEALSLIDGGKAATVSE